MTKYRAYDPNVGRWLSRDPIGHRGGLNLYGYVNNNPVRFSDPLGLEPFELETMDMGEPWAIQADGFAGMVGLAILTLGFLLPEAPVALPAAAGGANALKSRVNPQGFENNCGSAAIALDRTLAGAPASAINTGPMYMSEVAEVYGNQGMASYPSLASIVNFMSRAGDGARGIVYGGRANGELAHFFNVVNNNGNVVFIDGSTGKIADTLGFTFFQMMRTN